MSPKNNKKLVISSFVLLTFLILFVPWFLEWREQRLETRSQMLPKFVYVSLGRTGSSAMTDFLADSDDGLQSFAVSIETLDELTKNQFDPDITFIGKTSKVDVLYKYRHVNPDKYKDWKDIKLRYEIREKDTGKGVFQYEYNPYESNPDDVQRQSDITTVIHGYPLKKGQYVALVTVLKGHPDFLSYQTEVCICGSASLVDIWFQIVDQVLSL